MPAYTFPAHREDLSVLRIVCRNGFSHDLADLFLDDLTRLLPELRRQPAPVDPRQGRGDRDSTTRARDAGVIRRQALAGAYGFSASSASRPANGSPSPAKV